MKRLGGICGALLGALSLGLMWLPVQAASAQSMVVQPDGRIVLAGRIWPEAGTLARLNPDGSLDQTFGDGGFEIDRRLPGFRALALDSQDRIVGAAVGGFQLARYLPDGSIDPGFAGGGVGGTAEPDQVHFLYSDYGPSAVTARPGGDILVSGTLEVNGGGGTDGWLKRYDGDGRLIETVGHVPLPGGPATSASLADFLERPDGSFVGAGTGYGFSNAQGERRAFLARFLAGSGGGYDPGFGGVGLVRPAPPSGAFYTRGNAVVAEGENLLLAGRAAGSPLVARFDPDGSIDQSFDEDGFAIPPIVGPASGSSGGRAESWADDAAVVPGGIVAVGGTEAWSPWTATKAQGLHCTECPQPLLVRFGADGGLDPSFGEGGVLRLLKPDGGTFLGEIEEVVALSGGKLLVEGVVPSARTSLTPFVARLNPDGSYDPGFGEGGLTVPHFPCSDEPRAQLQRAGCVPTARLKLRLSGLRRKRPTLYLRLRPNLPWAGVRAFTLTLPKRLRLTRDFWSKLQLLGAAHWATVEVSRDRGRQTLFVRELGDLRKVRLRLWPGALRLREAGRRHRKLTFELGAEFADARWGLLAGNDEVVRRVG